MFVLCCVTVCWLIWHHKQFVHSPGRSVWCQLAPHGLRLSSSHGGGDHLSRHHCRETHAVHTSSKLCHWACLFAGPHPLYSGQLMVSHLESHALAWNNKDKMHGHETAIHKPVLTAWLDSEQCFSKSVHGHCCTAKMRPRPDFMSLSCYPLFSGCSCKHNVTCVMPCPAI